MTTTTNDGTFTIASGGSYVLNGGSFDNAGGTIGNGGTLEMESYTFTERGGSETGNPVIIDSATLDDDTTAGGGQFSFIGSDILTGTGTSPGISTGQTLTIESDSTALQLAKSLTNDGTLNVGDATTGGLYAQLGMSAAYTLTNDGTLNTVTGSGGVRYLRSNLTNDGTVNIDSAKTESDGGDGLTTTTNDGTFTIASGGSYVLNGGSFDNAGGTIGNGGTLEMESYTFTERGGSETGNPVIIDSATLDDDTTAGGGQFSFIGSDILTGTGTSPGISTGQTLTIESDSTALQLAKSLTNDGTLNVGDATTGGLYAQLGMSAAYTLTNDGTLNTVTGSGGVRYLRSNLTNDGTVNIDSAKTESDGGDGLTTTTNDGTFTIASGGSYVLNGGSFDNAGGTIGNGGTLEMESYTFTERGGSETGNPVIIDSATLDDDTTAGGGQFSFIGSDILTGTGTSPGISTGQTLTIESDSTALQLAKSLTNDGTLNVGDATTGGLYAQLGMSAAYTLTNDGTLNTVTGSGGVRYLRSNLTNDGTVNIDSAATQSDGGDGLTTTTNDGTFTIASGGSYVLNGGSFVAGSTGTLIFHIASATTFGTITATGTSVAGTADPVPDGGYVPPVNTEFEVIKDASYSGCFTTVDSGFTADCSNAHFHGVGLIAGSPLTDTTTTLGASSLNPSSYGQSVTFTATVSPTDGGGSVSFSSNGVTIANCNTQPLRDNGGSWQATCTTSVLTGGSDSIVASYSGDDAYGSSNASPITQTVDKVTPTVTWTAPAAISYGTALSATQLDATASVPGIFTYTPPTGTVLKAGTNQSLSVLFTPTDSTDYTTATGGTSITVTQVTPTVTWTAPAAISYGTALSATQLDATASVPGIFTYTPPTGTVLKAGTNQTLSVLFTPNDSTDYTTATGGTTITVSQLTPAVTWAAPAPITVGTALSATQLDATASVPGTFTYTPPAGTVLGVGANQTLSVLFTPTDSVDYTTASDSTTITVAAKGVPLVTWTAPAAISYGTGLSATQLDATASVPGTFTYTPPAGTVLKAGANQTLSVLFTPTDSTDYSTATATTTITVTQVTPTVTWATPAAITVGTALSTTQLDATASVPGTFTYTPPAGTVLGVGTNQTLSVLFTPTDSTDYTTAAGGTTITVTAKLVPTVTWATPAAITVGTALSATQLDATASVPGTFTYTPPAGTVLGVGTNQTLSVLFTPTDSTDYSTATATTTITVNAATAGTTTTLASSINPSTVSQTTSLTATVTGGSTPTGTVTFYDGTTSLGTSPVGAGGQATLSAPQLATVYAIGTHSLTATYSGDGSHLTSTSGPLTQTVDSPVFADDGEGTYLDIVNSATDTLANRFFVGSNSCGCQAEHYLAISPDGTRAYVLDPSSSGTKVQVVNTATGAVLSTIATPGWGADLVMAPSGGQLYVVDEYPSDQVTIISTATDSVTGSITGVNVSYFGPSAAAINPAGTELFVVLQNYGVDVVNLSTDRVVATVSLSGAEAIAAAPNGSAVYVTNGYLGTAENAGTVSVISTATNTITHTYAGMNEAVELAVSPTSGDVYAANVGTYIVGTTAKTTTPYVAVINPVAGTVSDITLPYIPNGIAVSPDGTRVYAATNNLSTNGIIYVINAATNGILAHIGGLDTADTVVPFGAAPAVPVFPSLAVTTKSLPGGTQGVTYDTTLAATGGEAPYSWRLTSGTLPAGLSFNASTGTIYGTPTAPGSATLTFGVSDSEYPAATATVTLTLAVAAGTTAPPACPSTPGLGLGTAAGCASASSTSSTGTATATSTGTRGTITVTAHGSGGITVGQYGEGPSGGVPFNSSGAPFDVALSDVNTFTSVTIKDCALNGATSLFWYNPAANGGSGAWELVTPAVYSPAVPGFGFGGGTPACLTVTMSTTSSPSLSQLTGTVFDGALAPESVAVSLGGSTPYSISGPVLSGSVTITHGLVSQVQGTVVLTGPHGTPVTIAINQDCLLGLCVGTISVTDPASGISETVPASLSLGNIGADQVSAKGEVLFGPGSPYAFGWSVTVTPPS